MVGKSLSVRVENKWLNAWMASQRVSDAEAGVQVDGIVSVIGMSREGRGIGFVVWTFSAGTWVWDSQLSFLLWHSQNQWRLLHRLQGPGGGCDVSHNMPVFAAQ